MSSRHNSSNERCDRHYAIILAAGASTRMGICKASLPWCNGNTLLSYQVEQCLQAGMTPIVVLGPHNAQRQQDCPPATSIVINPDPTAGKTHSIQIGLAQVPTNCGSVTLIAVDQPRPSGLYQRLLQAHCSTASLITAPMYQGRMGHPLLFANAMLPHLHQIREETLGIRQLVTTFAAQIQQVQFDTPQILIDLNTPERYQTHLQQAVAQACSTERIALTLPSLLTPLLPLHPCFPPKPD